MRPINFLVIFVVCLALVLFSLENTESASIHIVQGIQFQAPLCVILILAMGVGAVLAWLFSLWTRLQRLLASREQIRQMRHKDQRIQELEQDIERHKADIVEQHQLPPADSLQTEAQEAAQVLVK